MRLRVPWRRRGNWLVRWGGLGAAVVIVAVFVTSLAGKVVWNGSKVSVGAGYGCLSATRWTSDDPQIALIFPPGWRFFEPERVGHRNASEPFIVWRPTAWRKRVVAHIRIPLWMPLALVLIPTGLAWGARGRGWRRAKVGLCLGRGYNLAGNTTGVCPECGQSAMRP